MRHLKAKIFCRDNLGLLLKKIKLNVKIKVIFTELFNKKRLIDTTKLWPIIIDQKYMDGKIINFL